jgi:hypothetical protein
MFTFSFACNKEPAEPDLSFMTFSGFRYICIMYNNTAVANSLIWMICRLFYNLYVNETSIIFNLVPKNWLFI